MKIRNEVEESVFLQDQKEKHDRIITKINQLKVEKNAIILAHYYQPGEIQEIADYVGDSLGLSYEAAKTNAGIIVFAGVYFMAETAKILNPEKKVLLPDRNSGCSLADSCSPEDLKDVIASHPDHVVVSYINCSAAIKAMSDYICTSANADTVINSIPKEKPILFVPDKNLGEYLIRKTGREMTLWDGVCLVHEALSMEKILKLHEDHPEAVIIAHPESDRHLLQVASYIGSTTGMINFVKNSPRDAFIVGTEAGILHQMQKAVPHKMLIPAPSHDDNSCACSECGFMKLNTLEKLLLCLRDEMPEVKVPELLMEKAMVPLQRMLQISAN